MRRYLTAAAAALALAAGAKAHFVYVVPAADGAAVTAVFSDDLSPDESVPVSKIAGLTLAVRGPGGKDTPVPLAAGKNNALAGAVAGTGPRVVHGTVEYGVLAKGDAKPYLLVYHPKAVLGPVNGRPVVVNAPLELVPVPLAGRVAFQLIAAGVPVADAEVTVTTPEGKKEKVKTGADGRTPGFPGTGRFAAYGKRVEAAAGKREGKAYEEVRRYATLVVTVDEHPAAAAPAAAAASPFPPLPKAASSLGAVVSDGYLYVYGGHAGKTHSYDTSAVLGTFHRLKLAGGTKWEELPGGPILQGLNLAAHGGKVYRVGGMEPRNAPGTPSDNHSRADAARFDPATRTWEALPPLPAGRSSHDVVAVGDKLVVVGGWNQRGKDAPVWHDTTLVLDLAAKAPAWKPVPQPFRRRALTAAAVGSKVYVIAGMGPDGTDRRVDVLDADTLAWTTAPELPGADRTAFSPAAAAVNGRLVVNTSAGPVYRLAADGAAWEKVGEAVQKRMVARLVPLGPDAVALVGGAGGGANVDVVEVVRLAGQGERVPAAPAAKE
jgi:N-acetylneuraminic acid mutarotase